MKITHISAKEIFDSRGLPTVSCEIILENGASVSASVPSGASRGKTEALEMRDGGTRLMGLGVLKSIKIIEDKIAPMFIGKEPRVIAMDEAMIALDDTERKSHLGANSMLAVSIAICKAQALIEGLQVYELIAYLCENETVSIPFPMFNVINGGMHAHNNLRIQEFMVIPVGFSTFQAAIEMGVTLSHTLKKLLLHNGYSSVVGDEGGFAPALKHDTEALDILMEAIQYAQADSEGSLMIALDVAASQFYNPQSTLYNWHGNMLTSEEMIAWYVQLAQKYPLYAIEDGLSESDKDGWRDLYKQLGSKIEIVGDDIFTTNAELIYEGIDQQLANTVIIKPNQIGTVTEALQAIKLCQEYDMRTIVSHRSGETNDSFIADLAVGSNAGQIKAGGLSRGERMAKYNRLLEIERQLLIDQSF
jgi:phosphopyruvate hydratase